MKRREDVDLPEHVQRVLDRIVEEAKKLGRLEAVILFGSWAAGRAAEDSDVDVLVVAEVDSRLKTAGRLMASVYDIDVAVDVVVYRPEEWRRRKQLVGMLPYTAARDGVLWYGRAA